MERLRTIVLDTDPGELIGNEEALIVQLGCSRATVRQVARLLEREGLLRVKRGINGGYFSARPNADTIANTVSAYLESLDLDPLDVTIMTSALWVEAMRKAVAADRSKANAVVARLRDLLMEVKDDATLPEISAFEYEYQSQIFELAKSDYIKLIFDINIALGHRIFVPAEVDDSEASYQNFVPVWREVKLLELNTIALGDQELAALAGRYSRKIWYDRIQSVYQGAH